jgi:hypothetical protein
VFRQRQLDAAPSGDGPTLVLPLWHVERQDIALRGETVWLLNSLRLGDVISEVFKPIAVCSAQGVGGVSRELGGGSVAVDCLTHSRFPLGCLCALMGADILSR